MVGSDVIRVLTWNVQAGGGKRLPRIIAAISVHQPHVAVITEFQAGISGDALRAGLCELGLLHHLTTVAPRGRNSVLLASALPLGRSEVDIPEQLANHVIATRLGRIDLIRESQSKRRVNRLGQHRRIQLE